MDNNSNVDDPYAVKHDTDDPYAVKRDKKSTTQGNPWQKAHVPVDHKVAVHDSKNDDEERSNLDAPPPFATKTHMQPAYNAASTSTPHELVAKGHVLSDEEYRLASGSGDDKPREDHVKGATEAPPPDFSDYPADFFVKSDGKMISHDPHLNHDGEALYRFLLAKASVAPSFLLVISGSHTETHTRRVSTWNSNTNRTETHTQTYTETITDFSFNIDIKQHLLHDAPIWLLGDRDAAYRGLMVKQVDNTPVPAGESDKDLEANKVAIGRSGTTWRRKSTKTEEANSTGRWLRRDETGLPPWALLQDEVHGTEACVESEEARQALLYAINSALPGYDDSDLQPPSRTLRDWADEYCASKKLLKEFTFRKEVWGWDLRKLTESVRATVKANWNRPNEPVVSFVVGGDNTICIRPENRLSRTLSNSVIYFFLWVFLVYPLVIWPFKRYSKHGGGKWQVAGSAFPLNKWVHLPDSHPGQTVEEYQEQWTKAWFEKNKLAQPEGYMPKPLRQTPKGISLLQGKREGEWFSQWEDTIANYVRQGMIATDIISNPLVDHRLRLYGAGAHLDGYTDIASPQAVPAPPPLLYNPPIKTPEPTADPVPSEPPYSGDAKVPIVEEKAPYRNVEISKHGTM